MSNSPITLEALTCPNPDCRIAETGKCVEGFDIGECPNQLAIASPKTREPVKDEFESLILPEKPDVPVASGEILSLEEATEVLCSGPTRVLTIAGPEKCGKTTLGLSLYTAFQNGPFENLNFGGSLTLFSFEQRIHLAQAACGKNKPDTPRTPRGDGLGFLHLVLHSETTARVNLLISERSGEFYTDIADSKEECKDLYEIDRADLMLFLVDGEGLISDARHTVKNDILMLSETLFQNGILNASHQIGIVLAKFDQVLASEFKDRAQSDFNDLFESIRDRFESIPSIHSFIIAARPENSLVPPRYGVLNIIQKCLQPRHHLYISSQKKAVNSGGRWYFSLQPESGGLK